MHNLTCWGSSSATSCNNAELGGSKPGPSKRLAPDDELLLVLTRWCVGMLEQDLAVRFQLSQSHVSRIVQYSPKTMHAQELVFASARRSSTCG